MRIIRVIIMLMLLSVIFDNSDIQAQNNVIDEVAWIVGDEAIYKSEVEETRKQAQLNGIKWEGDPYCLIPEELAINKLFLTQAKLDSITASPSEVNQQLDYRIQSLASNLGGMEKIEEYFEMSMSQIREKLYESTENDLIISSVKSKITGKVNVTPAEVRRYLKEIPAEDIPYVPTQVEVQIITLEPKIPQADIDEVKAELREYTDRILAGEVQFSTLALLYSEDPGTARKGGECGFVGRGEMVPEFSAVAFNLTDPKKVSKIVETEYGFHIIQLIERRGDRVNVRHILRKPRVPQSSIDECLLRLDSIANDIRNAKFTFEEGATYISSDKDTRNNKGLMTYTLEDRTTLSKFEMQQLPQDVSKVVNNMHVGEISDPFVMQMPDGKEVCAIVKLKSKISGHKATMADDYQILQDKVLLEKRAEVLEKWIREKQRITYVKINEGWNDCEFKYPGWGQH
jgi:peptidyl-prolyl cis-trans isomerase SurA